MSDPYVFGDDDPRGHAAAGLEAEAYARAYHARGDQLAALEAEAAATGHRNLTAGGWLRTVRLMFGPWSDDGGR